MEFTLGISPCPNDTFIFDQMINEPNSLGIRFNTHLEDVETLNNWALDGKLDITKLSFATYLQVKDQYELLETGAALGFGVGPLLVSNKHLEFDSFESLTTYVNNSSIAIPGKYTTANLLLSNAFPDAKNKREIIFSDIEKQVQKGTFDLGLLIHESRFTYQQHGLHKVMDMGAWWENTYQCAIPLGGIVIKKNLAAEYKDTITALIQKSLQTSYDRLPVLSEFIIHNAQEMSEEVMKQHIDLYVNEESMQLSDIGKKAITQLEKVEIK